MLKPAAAKYLLLDWKNVEDANGNPVPYSSEKALEFFNNPALKDLYDFVLEMAGEVGNFLQEQHEESVKNLPTA